MWAGCRRHAFALVEPLRDLFKDEVGGLERLGIAEEILVKHRSRAGLAVRLLARLRRRTWRRCGRGCDCGGGDPRAGLYEKVWQAFAVLLPVRSVGVMGMGGRTD